MNQESRDEQLEGADGSRHPQDTVAAGQAGQAEQSGQVEQAADAEVVLQPRRRRRWGGLLRNRVRQMWRNVQIWIPFLLNPFERRRLLRLNEHDRLSGRMVRHDLDWTVELPRQCWKTGEVADLVPCVFERRLRSFERPLAILGVMFLGLMFVSTFSCLLGPWLTPTLYGTLVVLALIVLLIKSWRESIRLTIWSRPEHAETLDCPDMVVHNDHLYIHLPSTELARTAAAAVSEFRELYPHSPADPRSAGRPEGF